MKRKRKAVVKALISQQVIEDKILLIKNHRVMLDRDLAELYGVETRVLNQAVRRNLSRFPADFMFKLTREEIMRISQFVISLKYSKSVYAFTEQGIAMLSSVLNSEHAIQVNIQIMRAFVKLKQFLATHRELADKLEELEVKIGKHEVEIQAIFKAIRQLIKPPEKPIEKIGF